jgi:hypothetical protein
VILIAGFDIGQNARGLLGCLAEGVLISLWKGIEMSFDPQLQSAVFRYHIYGDGGFFNRPAKPEQRYAWNTGLVRPQLDE